MHRNTCALTRVESHADHEPEQRERASVVKNHMLGLTAPTARTTLLPLGKSRGKTRAGGRLTTVGLRPPFVSHAAGRVSS
jgi:hypothetical protein